jgi:hypothetical protein
MNQYQNSFSLKKEKKNSTKILKFGKAYFPRGGVFTGRGVFSKGEGYFPGRGKVYVTIKLNQKTL